MITRQFVRHIADTRKLGRATRSSQQDGTVLENGPPPPALCTTDDPIDDLRYHKQIAVDGCHAKVFPAFRPDKAMNVHLPEMWNEWVGKLEAASGRSEARHNKVSTAGEREETRRVRSPGPLSG